MGPQMRPLFFNIEPYHKPMEPVIRPAQVEDAEAILAFATLVMTTDNSTLATAPGEFNYTVEQERDWIKRAQNPNTLVIVAVLGQQVVGLLDVRPNTRKRFAHWCELGMSVHPDYRNQKIGHALLQYAIDWATTNTRLEQMRLEVFHDNHRALHLYIKFGFVLEGVKKDGCKMEDGTYKDVLTMCRPLI